MSTDILNTLLLGGLFLLLFASAELLYRRFHFKVEVTRKYVHISTGLLTMLFPPLIGNHWLVLLLCFGFLIILILSKRYNFLRSVNDVERVTRGSYMYPIIVYGCYMLFLNKDQYIYYYLPILIMAISDPVAALVGKQLPWKPYEVLGHRKTLSGSLGFFISAFILSNLLMTSLENFSLTEKIFLSLEVALATSFAEAISNKGYDNLTIPLAAVLILWIQ